MRVVFAGTCLCLLAAGADADTDHRSPSVLVTEANQAHLSPTPLLPSGERYLLEATDFDRELHSYRHESSLDQMLASDDAWIGDESTGESFSVGRKSPIAAFLLSALVPGAGQFYNEGLGLKAVAFLGADIGAWVAHFSFKSDGDDMTDEFQQFRKDHWSEERYRNFEEWSYDADSLAAGLYREFSHTLPGDPEDQQYYEQVGKYDQYAWGWDDAVLFDGRTYADFGPGSGMPRIANGNNVPSSANRTTYEIMRDDANTSYDWADRMLFAATLNRAISAVEAFLSARAHNRAVDGGSSAFSSIRVKPSLKSKHQFGDTPYVTVSWRF